MAQTGGSEIIIGGLGLGNALQVFMDSQDIVPGSAPSYQICKTIYTYHPLGAKIVDFPIQMAQSQQRRITVPMGPEEVLVEAFLAEWKAIGVDKIIANLGGQARMYGVSSIAMLAAGVAANVPVDYGKLAGKKVGFNVLDPLNTAGSLILNQDPNVMEFQKIDAIAVSGKVYHPSRTLTLMNESPIYIDYTTSGFGYVGRSVYQRGLFPLKSFLNTLKTDDMISLKAGVIVAKVKQQSSVIDRAMSLFNGLKREVVKEAQVGNVISISTEGEEIESMNLQNLEGPYTLARKNIIENIASACGTPAKILLAETFAEGFGEGTEDAKHIAQFINGIREWLGPVYAYFDRIVMHRAWSQDFFKIVQARFPEEWGGKSYEEAFYTWKNSFSAAWPSLIEEPDSEKIKVDDVRLRAIIALMEVLIPEADPDNKAAIIRWACDNFNELKLLFPTPLLLNYDDLQAFAEENAQAAKDLAAAGSPGPGGEERPKPPKPFADSAAGKSLAASITRLIPAGR